MTLLDALVIITYAIGAWVASDYVAKMMIKGIHALVIWRMKRSEKEDA